MKRLLILLLLVSPAAANDPAKAAGDEFLVVGYLPWYRVESVSGQKLGPVTDLIYFGIKPRADGRLESPPIEQDALTTLTEIQKQTGCRLHVCVGGGGRSQGFAALTASSSRRTGFVRELCRFCKAEGLIGVDYDWEHPEGDVQLANYAALITETKRELGDEGVVTVAQSPWRDFGPAIYDAVDRVHVMSYNHRFPHARLEDAQKDVVRMLEFGCPAEKIVLGIPFYGRNAKGRTRIYADLVGNADADADLIDGYALNGRNTVIGKTRYAIEAELAGVMIWEVGQDATDPHRSLLRAIEGVLEAPRSRSGVRLRR